MLTSAIKKQTFVCCSILINSLYIWYFKLGNLESWGKERKSKSILLLAYIADVSCLTNRPFYMRTLSLNFLSNFLQDYNSNRDLYCTLH